MKLKQLFDVKINRIVHTFSLTGLAIMALTPHPVAADTDDKSFPGSMCHEGLAIESNAVVRGVDGFFNFGTGVVDAECPIVRDAFTNPSISSATVSVANRSSTGNIVCILFSLGSDGARVQSQTRGTTTNTGVETLTFTGLQAATDGYYHLSCDIPPNGPGGTSRIISYRVNEAN